jgi:hypothetical protein
VQLAGIKNHGQQIASESRKVLSRNAPLRRLKKNAWIEVIIQVMTLTRAWGPVF